jgi:hypothetical protein
VVSTTVLPWLFVLDRTTGTRTPESVEAGADEAAAEDAAIWRDAVTEVSMVLPAELVVVMATTVGAMELAAELAPELSADDSADDSAAELWEEASDEDPTTDEPRPEETAADEERRADETEEASEDETEEASDGVSEDCAAEEDAAAEESELCWEETELWAAEEGSEDETRVEETTLEPEVLTTTVCERDAGEAELDTEADEADGESALLSPPVVLEGAVDDPAAEVGASDVETADVSVVNETEVVLGSVTMTASVLVVDSWAEEVVIGAAMTVVLLPLSCLLRNSARTATSCFAISMRREASDGLSFWMCSRALWSRSNTPA